MSVKAIITDFGNVLIPFDRRREAENLIRAGIMGVRHESLARATIDVIHGILSRPANIKLLDSFEQGKITDEDFVRELEHRLGVPLPRNIFWPAHAEIFGEPNRPLIDLLRTLKSELGFKLVGLTNTDPYRLNYMLSAIRLPFDGVVASCFEGVAKPNRRLFQHALDIADVPAGDALFIDDVEDYVTAASVFGLGAHQYGSFDVLVAELKRWGVIA